MSVKECRWYTGNDETEERARRHNLTSPHDENWSLVDGGMTGIRGIVQGYRGPNATAIGLMKHERSAGGALSDSLKGDTGVVIREKSIRGGAHFYKLVKFCIIFAVKVHTRLLGLSQSVTFSLVRVHTRT